jgi:hypothetical protein
MEIKLGGNLSFRADASMHIEDFKIIDPSTGKDYKF